MVKIHCPSERYSIYPYRYAYINIDIIIFLSLFSGSAPLTTVQLLWVNMIMDTLGALALATEPPHDGLMKRPPVGRNNFITRIMWRNIVGQSIYQLAILGVLKFDGKTLFKINGSDSDSVLNTLIFNTFVFCQVTQFPCKSRLIFSFFLFFMFVTHFHLI